VNKNTFALFAGLVFFAAAGHSKIPVEIPLEENAAELGKNDAEETSKIKTEAHWGVAFGTGWIQDYPGANQGRMRYLVMPTYKGKYITIDRQDGVKGELLDENMLKFSVSFMFLFPTRADDMPIRRGMPDLAWTFQLGPEMQLYLIRSYWHTMYVRIPFRFVATTDFRHEFEYRGWNLAPGIRNVFYLGPGLGEITTRLEFEYTSEAYADLFHQVDAKYAIPGRPAYNAQEGLMDYILGVSYSYYDLFPWSFFIGGNVYLMSDAKNRASPLLIRTRNFSVLGGIIYYF